MGKLLAICIPTYNRPQYLIKMLKTICIQLNEKNCDRIQVCVSDNASEESYQDVVRFMKTQKIDFIYHRMDKNYGADINFLKAVEIATAEYCWLIGDDDGIVDGAIDLILNYIDANIGVSVFVGNRVICDKNLKPFIKDNWTGQKDDFFVDFRKEEQIIQYFDMLNSTTSLGYLSTLIVRKADWMENVSKSKKFIGTIYVHVAQILLLLKDKGVMMCMHPCIALSRFGNDGFYENLKQRIFLDYRGFLMITEIFDGSPKVVGSLKGIVRRHYNKIFLYAMACAGKLTTEEEDILAKLDYSNQEIKIFRRKGKLYLLGGLGVNILKAMLFNFTWFYKTCFITIQKI